MCRDAFAVVLGGRIVTHWSVFKVVAEAAGITSGSC